MLKNLLKKYKPDRTIISNFSYLAIFQIFTFISPLITYPYLIKVIGMDLNGVVVFGQTIATYITLIINFGFNISGSRSVAVARGDNRTINNILTHIYLNKFLIWISLLIIWLVIINVFNFFKAYYTVYLWSFFITINELLFPVWLFQGLEKMKFITIVNIVTKSVFIVMIFVVIKEKSDYYKVTELYALGSIVAGLLSSYIVFGKLHFRFVRPSAHLMKKTARDAFPLFLSTMSVQIYAHASKLLVGSFLGMVEVSLYDLCEKIITVSRVPLQIIQQVIFPKISRERNICYVDRVKKIALVINCSMSIIILCSMQMIMNYMLGKVYANGYVIVGILSLSTVVSGYNLFYGGCRLIPWGFSNAYSKIAIENTLFFIISATLFYFVNLINVYSIPSLTLITEIFCFYQLYSKCKKLNLLHS